jgi:hypothetical protein
MKTKGLGWAFRGSAMVGSALLCMGCGGYAITATDGTVFQQSETSQDSVASALTASASRDLPCASNELDVRRLDPERRYVVSGCGRRVSYRVLTPSLTQRRLELVSRSTLPTVGDHPVSLRMSQEGLGERHADLKEVSEGMVQ